MTGVWIRWTGWRLRHIVPGMGVVSFFVHLMPRMRIGRHQLFGGGMVMLPQRGRCGGREKQAEEILHAASPSSGRMVTTRNIPACM